jgi:hypothetical protein
MSLDTDTRGQLRAARASGAGQLCAIRHQRPRRRASGLRARSGRIRFKVVTRSFE